MRIITALALALVLVLSLQYSLTSPARAADKTDPAIAAMGAYLPTDDIETSQAFYQTLFQRDPLIKLDDFVAFHVAGGWFAIVAKTKFAPHAKAGTGVVPYLQANDLSLLQDRAKQAGATNVTLLKEPGIHILKITDPNGQLVEFFTLTGQ